MFNFGMWGGGGSPTTMFIFHSTVGRGNDGLKFYQDLVLIANNYHWMKLSIFNTVQDR